MEPANKGRKLPTEPLSADEFGRLIEAIDGRGPLAIRNRALLTLLFRSGLRVSEALNLRPGDLDPANQTALVREGKGKKRRTVFANGELWPRLESWQSVRKTLNPPRKAPLFCSVSSGHEKAAGRPLTTAYVRRLLAKLGQEVGIEHRVHAHGLRAGHAVHLIRNGATLDDIRDQLGHVSLATTDAYLREVAPEARIERLRALSL